MVSGTHVAFGSTLFLAGSALFEYEVSIVTWSCVAIGSILPDVDLPTSFFGRTFWWASTRLEKRYGHRTITHSFLAMLVLATLLYPLLHYDKALYFWCVVGGYWSHLWIDMFNLRGVDLFWPSPIRVVMPGKEQYRMQVGSKSEMILMTGLMVAVLGLYPLSNVGLWHGLHTILGNFDVARDEYQKKIGVQRYALHLEAVDNLTMEQVVCECPVIGLWKEGLIVDHKGQPRAVGTSPVYHDLFPKKSWLLKGEQLHVVSQKYDMAGRNLRWLLDRVDQGHEYYLMGELFVAGNESKQIGELQLYHPIIYTGDIVRLHYAKAKDLERYLDMVVAQGEVFIQYWLAPGEAPVSDQVEVDGEMEIVPERLRGWL